MTSIIATSSSHVVDPVFLSKWHHMTWRAMSARPWRRVPYRESKITHLFKSALHGWGRIMLCVNVSAAAADYDETIVVLKYAAMVGWCRLIL